MSVSVVAVAVALAVAILALVEERIAAFVVVTAALIVGAWPVVSLQMPLGGSRRQASIVWRLYICWPQAKGI